MTTTLLIPCPTGLAYIILIQASKWKTLSIQIGYDGQRFQTGDKDRYYNFA